MKPRTLALLSGTVTLGFGYWLAEHSRDSREIWFSVGAWVSGFWFASSLLSNSAQPETQLSSGEEYEEDYDEEYEAEEDGDEYDDEENDDERSR